MGTATLGPKSSSFCRWPPAIWLESPLPSESKVLRVDNPGDCGLEVSNLALRRPPMGTATLAPKSSGCCRWPLKMWLESHPPLVGVVESSVVLRIDHPGD